ncbi:MAG: polysaccharide deacetylase family protein [Acidobacteria bacterium]|nr:polysaccharide deacetylase family protein [Acidobacteriota bacterium]
MLKKFSWALGEIVWLLLAALPSGMTFPGATPPVDTGDGQSSRQVVITMDDLPKTMGSESLESATRVTEAILAALREHKAPTLGFVIGNKVFMKDEVDARLDLLRRWVAAGAELGNHSFSHPSFQKMDLIPYEDDVLRGDLAPRLIMEETDRPVRYFRHPYNQTGPSIEVKAEFRAFMAARGTIIAPFTVEHADYLFNRLWLEARENGNEEQAERIRIAYLDHLSTAFDFAEELALDTFGGPIPQVFLIHANDINALCLDEMLTRLEDRGYRFIPMDQALEHPAYATPDTYVGGSGISWLHRWRHSLDLPDRLRQEPDPPGWLLKAWRAAQQQATDN